MASSSYAKKRKRKKKVEVTKAVEGIIHSITGLQLACLIVKGPMDSSNFEE